MALRPVVRDKCGSNKDVGDDEDWFPEFYIAMCVWHEDMVRKQIGLPSLFTNEEKSKGLDNVKYWAFKDFVRSGNKFPHRDWQQLYGSELSQASLGDQAARNKQAIGIRS